jgi:hypothetical protein
MSTYTDRLKIELMASGANANTWGTRTNNNLELIDTFGNGYLAKSVAGSANVTLTTGNADPSAESANKVIEFTGALTGDIHVFIPAVENNYIFFNNTTGSQTLKVCATGHAANAITITQGAHTIAYNNASNKMVDLFSNSLGTVSFKGVGNVAGNVTVRANGQIVASSFTGNGSTLSGVSTLPQNTQMVFLQASAPTGWTQNTTAALNKSTLRIITSGTAGTGGSDDFDAVFTSSKTTSGSASCDISPLTVGGGTVSDHTLSTPEIPSHTHPYLSGNPMVSRQNGSTNVLAGSTNSSNNTGGGGSHTHPITGAGSVSGTVAAPSVAFSVPAMDIKHSNVIVCSKD